MFISLTTLKRNWQINPNFRETIKGKEYIFFSKVLQTGQESLLHKSESFRPYLSRAYLVFFLCVCGGEYGLSSNVIVLSDSLGVMNREEGRHLPARTHLFFWNLKKMFWMVYKIIGHRFSMRLVCLHTSASGTMIVMFTPTLAQV